MINQGMHTGVMGLLPTNTKAMRMDDRLDGRGRKLPECGMADAAVVGEAFENPQGISCP
jgi:hypothetical protein